MEHTTPNGHNGAGHETSEVNPQLIVASLAMLAIGTLLVFLLVVGIFRVLKTTSSAPPTVVELPKQPMPPEPRVEIEPWKQIITVHQREDHVLTSYAWVDQKEGVVRIPVDKAIDILAEKGLPSHDYLQDILAGRKAPAAKAPAAKGQGK